MIDFWRITATRLGTAARTLLAQVRRSPRDSTDPAEGEDDSEVLQPLGLFVRPGPDGQPEAVVVRRGNQVVVLGMVDKTLSIFDDVEEGETRLYGAQEPTARFRCRKDGSVDIESKSITDVRLNGGSLKVARVTDPVRVGTLAGTAGPWPVVFTFTPADADGGLGTPVGGPTVLVSAVVSNAGGADRVKA